jgi:translation elongation factor EF-4
MKLLQLRGAVKIAVLLLCLPLTSQWVMAQTETAEQAVISLSKQKWQWMADKKLDALTALFHDDSVFVHMSRTLSKTEELEVIKTGNIHYKKADIHEVSVKLIGNTAILLNKITLLAVVRGNEVTNPFVVTEVYVQENSEWKLASMSFTRLVTPQP